MKYYHLCSYERIGPQIVFIHSVFFVGLLSIDSMLGIEFWNYNDTTLISYQLSLSSFC